MPLFRYKAIGNSGEPIEGEMQSPDEATVIERLHDLGHVPIRAWPASARAAKNAGPFKILSRRRGLTDAERTTVTRELATLVHAGVSLDRSLKSYGT